MDNPSLILVVDDQPRAREALAGLLALDGYRLAFAASGPEAIDLAVSLRPDLVLLDIMMPDMDGYEVCRHLRNDPRTAAVPLIMVTALDDRASLLEGLAAGADDFVSKPFQSAELRARVQTVTRLNRYRGLWESRERYEQLVEQSPSGVLICDVAGGIRLANPALRRLLAPAGALPAANLLDLVAPERRAALAERLQALASGAAAQLQLETTLLAAGGTRLPVELAAGRCEWDTGPAFQILIRDITDRRRAELLEEERRHVAYELHDGVAQMTAGLYQHLQLYTRRFRPRAPEAAAALAELVETARRTVGETRRVIEGLRPSALDDFGLAGALAMLADSLRDEGWEITCADTLGAARLPASIETALFRIAQEALSNTRKHAGALRAAISLSRDDDVVCLELRDWGPGFDEAALPRPGGVGGRVGLRGMRDRAAILGGSLEIESVAGAGVRVVARIPVALAAEEATDDDR